ncbi:ribosomal RNA small subunit methyltransferase A [Labrys miyagiensis]
MAQIDTLPPLREVIRQHELMAKKSLGQNFLLDLNLTAKIARAGGSLEGINVVEVGPGPGGLTRALLASGARHVVAVERDERCLAALAQVAEHYPGRLTVHSGDALEARWPELIERLAGPVRIIANLPYNVATPLLIGWLKTEPWPPWFDSMILMFQKEVAERIVATEADDAYGRLGVLAGWRTQAQIVFDVPPGAFVPPPKVTSSVVHLRPRAQPLPCTAAALERVTQAAFGQRRKMLRQSLKGLGGNLQAALDAAGLRPDMRAEEVPVEGFVALANAFAS